MQFKKKLKDNNELSNFSKPLIRDNRFEILYIENL